jgi:hypothetical protein
VKTKEDALKIRKMTLNAKSETAFTLPSFRVPILKRRCLVPSTGYFEFHHEGKEAVPLPLIISGEKEEERLDVSSDSKEFKDIKIIKELMMPFATERIRAYRVAKDFLKRGVRD